jgi:hypothetical protein
MCPHTIIYTSEERGDVDAERPDADATSVRGLTLLVYAAFSY